MKRLKQSLDRKTEIEHNLRGDRRQLKKICAVKDKEITYLKAKLQQVDYGNDEKEILKLPRSKIKIKSDFKRYKAKTSLKIRNLKIINSELQKEVSTLQIINENLKVKLDDTNHVWEIDAGENVLFCGKVIKAKIVPQNNICTLTISYWAVEEGLEDYEDYFMALSQILADFYIGDLVFIQPD